MTTIHAAEAGHWYWPTGLPAYEVPDSKGNQRPTTLRDARKLGLLPSVTTIIKTAAQPGLEIWKQRQVLAAALTLPRLEAETDDAFVSRVLTDAQEEARQAADKGKAIHAAIQSYYEGDTLIRPEITEPLQDNLSAFFGVDLVSAFIPERSFAHVLGFGGKADLHNPWLVLDIKTKEFSNAREVATYDEQVMQVAAYRMGLGFPYARCANVFVSTSNPGLIWIKEHRGDDLTRAWEMFTALLHYWQSKTGHRPRAS